MTEYRWGLVSIMALQIINEVSVSIFKIYKDMKKLFSRGKAFKFGVKFFFIRDYITNLEI